MDAGAAPARAGRLAQHGGRLSVARALQPDAPTPWIDLSTGINPRAYPAPRSSAAARARLPDPVQLASLERAAAAAFGVDDPARVVATAGTELALRLLPVAMPRRTSTIVGPT